MDLSLGLSESEARVGEKEAEVPSCDIWVCVPDSSPVDLTKSRV